MKIRFWVLASPLTRPLPESGKERGTLLERVRGSFELCVYGYVVMLEHVHLLLSEPRQRTLADALKSLKQGVARRLIDEAEHFWQKRSCDFNVRNESQFVEKLRYIHRKSGETRIVRARGGLGMEQLSAKA